MHRSKLQVKNLLVWLHPNINDPDDRNGDIVKELRQTVDTINLFTDVDQCIDFVTDVADGKIVLIIPAVLYQSLVPLIHDIPQLHAMYILRNDAISLDLRANEFRNVKEVSSSIDSLRMLLSCHIEQWEQELSPISIISPDGTGKPNLNELPPAFMYLKILKEILLDIDNDENAKEELIHFWYEQYHDNESQLKKIGKFEREYLPGSAIRWYTQETFAYDILNRALRTMDVEVIMKMAFFLRDLLRQIQQRSNEQVVNQLPQCLYRGQGMSNVEFEKLCASEGGLLSFNGFLSTSLNPEVSMGFCPIPPQDPQTTPVLFRIHLDRTSMSSPFASLNGISQFPAEEEVLFSMHSIFRIGKVTRANDDGPWEVELTSTNDNDEDLKQVSDYVRADIGEAPGWYRLGHLLVKIGYFDKAEEIYQMLLNQTPQHNSAMRALLYNQLAITKHHRGEFPKALEFYQRKLQIDKSSAIVHPPHLAATYNNIASIYVDMGQCSEALHFYQETLKIEQKFLLPDSPDLAVTYDNIGRMYRKNADYPKALQFYEKALAIYTESSPSNNPDLARTYHNIATVHYQLDQHQQALDYQLKALRIEERSLLPNHRSVGMTYCSIGQAWKKLNNYPKALEYYQKALGVFDQSLSQEDPVWATIYNNLGALYLSQEDYANALTFLYKTLAIEQKKLPPDHPDLAQTYSNIACAYGALGEHEDALKFCRKACAIGEKSLSSNHPVLGDFYKNTARTCFNMGRYSEALRFSRRALSIVRMSFGDNHPRVQECKEDIFRTESALAEHRVGFF